MRELEHKKRLIAQKREQQRLEMLSIADKLNSVIISLRRKVAEDDKLYGSVSVSDISKALKEQGFAIDKKDIALEQPIKQLGEFNVSVRVGAQITANIRVVIEKEE